MVETAKALYKFFSGFGIPAYTTQTVPDDAELPYITYSCNEPEWNIRTSMYAQVWYYTRSNTEVFKKADEICAAIGSNGVKIPCDGGFVVIWPETPMQQLMVDGNTRCSTINLTIGAYHMPGT